MMYMMKVGVIIFTMLAIAILMVWVNLIWSGVAIWGIFFVFSVYNTHRWNNYPHTYSYDDKATEDNIWVWGVVTALAAVLTLTWLGYAVDVTDISIEWK